jgi:hypothetical protein
MSDCCINLNAIPQPAVAGPALADAHQTPCDMATYVKICEPDPPAPIIGEDCLGAPISVVAPKAVLTVPAPGAVQMVKICKPTGEFEREYATLCAPDGTKVLVVTAWDTAAPLATAPVVETYTLAGAVYAGDRALLVDCAAEKLDIVSEEYCSGGFTYERISFYDVSTTPPTLASTLWRDQSGAAVADPGPGQVGACPPVIADRPVKIWHESVTSTRSIQDIVAATGTVHVQTITVTNVGTQLATIEDDFGNQTRLYPAQTWSWSAVSGQDAWDTLGYSTLTVDATGTDVHVTAAVLP